MTGKRWRCVVEARVLRRRFFLTGHLDICLNTWIKPPIKQRSFRHTIQEWREKNINYFTCPASTVDIQGELLKYDV